MDVREIAIDKIVVHDSQTRSHFGSLRELTESIKYRGVQDPVLLRKVDDNKYELFVGNRRLEASKSAGKDTIPSIVYDWQDIDSQTMLEMNLVENVIREEINPIDEANGYERLQREYGVSDDTLVKRLGVTKKRLKDRKRLLKTSRYLQDAVLNDIISMASAFEISRLPEELHEKYIEFSKDLRGDRLTSLIDKKLESLSSESEGKKEKKNEIDAEEVKMAVKTLKSCSHVVARGMNYSDDDILRLRDINFRKLEKGDLKIFANFVEDVAKRVPEEIDVNEMATVEIIAAVEGPRNLNIEWPIVRQGLIDMVMSRAKDIAKSKANGDRPQVTYAVARAAIEEFFEDDEEDFSHSEEVSVTD